MARDVFRRLLDETIVALRCAGDEWPHALLSETLVPDAWMGLVEKRDGRRWLVPAGESPRTERDDRLLLVRNRRLTAPLEIPETQAACGTATRAAAELLVYWAARDDDLAALGRTLLPQGGELTAAQLAQAIAGAGAQTALREFARAHPAEQLVDGDHREALLNALRETLKPFLFDTGMLLDRVARLEFTSRTLAHRRAAEREAAARLEQIKAREMVEQAARAAAQRRLDDMAGLLAKLRSVAETDRGQRWHELLPALAPAERGRLLENLWRITPDRTRLRAIALAAGLECIWLDPAAPEAIANRVRLPESLGSVRSVSYDAARDWILVGAARGVWVLAAETGEIQGRYEAPTDEPPRMGFNAAAICATAATDATSGAGSSAEAWLWATHSQLGCWRWALARPETPLPVLVPQNGAPRTIRGATALPDGRVLIAADDAVGVYARAGALEQTIVSLGAAGRAAAATGGANPLERGSSFIAGEGMQPSMVFDAAPAAIQCIAVLDRDLYVGTSNGLLLRERLDAGQGMWQIVHRGASAIETIAARRWNDLSELVIPAGAQGVCGVFPDEGIVTRMLVTRSPVRRVWVCDDAIVALNDRRDRLTVATSTSFERTDRDVPIGRMLNDAAQDVCLVTQR